MLAGVAAVAGDADSHGTPLSGGDSAVIARTVSVLPIEMVCDPLPVKERDDCDTVNCVGPTTVNITGTLTDCVRS